VKYQTLIPITHNGQELPVGLVFSDADTFGKKEKTPLEVDRLLARKRIATVPVLPTEPPKPEADSKAEDKGKK
jgi:hypothetical protein